MKRVFYYIAAIISADLLNSSAFAGEVIGTVSTLNARASDNLHLVTLNGTYSGTSPSCATHNYMMIKDENSTAGKSQYAMLMSAWLAGKSVRVIGAGTCTRWSDGEDIESIIFQ
ncbi:MAG: hypothetical protein V4530_03315 [Pseudomonadota bacterium]